MIEKIKKIFELYSKIQKISVKIYLVICFILGLIWLLSEMMNSFNNHM